jgi:hypothetical protein
MKSFREIDQYVSKPYDGELGQIEWPEYHP